MDDSVDRRGMTRTTMLKGGLGAALALPSALALLEASASSAAVREVSRSFQRGVKRGGTMVVATGDGLGRDFFVGNSFGPQGYAYTQFAWPLWGFSTGGRQLVSRLAVGYQPSRDRLEHVIVLRDGIKFHDGSPVTAQAVAQNLRAAFFPDHELRGPGTYLMIPLFWGGFPGIVKRIEALDRRRLKITLSEPRSDIRGALPFIPIMNPAVLADKNYGTSLSALQAAGSGPFRIANFAPGQFAEFTKVRGFFDEAYLDRVRLQLVPDGSARYLALRSGQAHVAIGLGNADWNAAIKNSRYRPFVSALSNNMFLGLNSVKNPLLASKRDLREALVRALNRPAYVSSYWGKGLAKLAGHVALGIGVNGYNPRVKPLPYDPRGAQQLLRKAGVSDLSLSIVSPPAFAAAPELAAMLQAIAADLARVDVELTIRMTDVPGWLAGIAQADLWPAPYGGSVGNGVPIAALYFGRPPGSPYDSPIRGSFKKLLKEAAVSLDNRQRDAKLRRLMALSAQWVSGIPIAHSFASAVGLSKVRNFSVSAAPIDPAHRTWMES